MVVWAWSVTAAIITMAGRNILFMIQGLRTEGNFAKK